jgi:alkaline phosphatase D
MIIKFFSRLFLGILLIIASATLLWTCENQQDETYVVMLSMDGFRWDYPDHANTPNLDRIAANGVRARSLKPSFPSKTFPNHYTMVTGLYPDHHGIVQNSFFDPPSNSFYQISDREKVRDGYYYGGEPIWVTAELQGVTSASYFWVASEADINGIHPTYFKEYTHTFPFSQRIDSVIGWLKRPEASRPRLVLWYMDEPDSKGHYFGPESQEMTETVETLDSLVGVFLTKLNELEIADAINVIVTSDHGMGPTSNERVVFLDDYIDTSSFDIIEGYNPNYLFKAKTGMSDMAWEALTSIPHVAVWKHGEVPARLNYGTHERTLDFILVADSSWSVGFSYDNRNYDGGAHGYDNDNKDMHAIFYAMGPDFKENYTQDTFENVDIYPLICNILGLKPAKTDGNLEHVTGMLK